ncbi:PRC-barrel domain-containing protein [Dactylosporangium sp. CS-033363]|uniref:PRC-barrel domain-containing protein n=1 Tax=Dactylosporangium sp. CS-033363 TaxID=3239935 RepID=UPI003D91D318
MTANHTDIATLPGRDVYDRDGEKVGTVGQVYADRAGQPTWASVNTGLFGLRESLVPLAGATARGDALQVAFDKATVKDAPNIDHNVDEPLTGEQTQELFRHYQQHWDGQATTTRDGYDGVQRDTYDETVRDPRTDG